MDLSTFLILSKTNFSLIDYKSTRPQIHNENFDEHVENCPTVFATKTHEESETRNIEQEVILIDSRSEQLNGWILQVSELQRTVEKLEKVIKMKDNQIEDLKKPKNLPKRGEKNVTDVSMLNFTGL